MSNTKKILKRSVAMLLSAAMISAGGAPFTIMDALVSYAAELVPEKDELLEASDSNADDKKDPASGTEETGKENSNGGNTEEDDFDKDYTIKKVEPLKSSLRSQTMTEDEDIYEAISFPEFLTVTTMSGEELELEVDWYLRDEDTEIKAGSILYFDAELPVGYELKAGVKLPSIRVSVKAEADDGMTSDATPSQVTNATPSELMKMNLLSEDGVYEVGSLDEYEEAIEKIAKLEDGSEVTLLLTANISNTSNRFAGVSGKRITVTSDDTAPDEGYRIELGQEMEGDVILDKVFITTSESRPIYANGHLFMTTENLPVGRTAGYSYYGRISKLFGGGSKGNNVESTNLVLNGGQIENVYGGGHDSNVTGDVHITLDGNANAANFYGGGLAEETSNGKVLGDVIVEGQRGILRSFLGGGNNQYIDASRDRTPAEVKGDVIMTFGFEGAQEGSMILAISSDSGGGSENSTVGNVFLNFLEGSATNPNNALDISGAGFNDDVKGTVNILVDGGQIDTVFGVGFEDYRDAVFIDGHRTRILNEDNLEDAVYIKIINVSQTDDFLMMTADGLGMGISGSQKTDLVNGDVTIEVENSDIDQVCIGGRTTNYSTEWAELEGEGNIIIKDSNVYAIRGHKVNYENEKNKSNVYFEGTEHSEIGYTYWVDNVTVGEGADVMIGSADLWDDEMLPFYETRNLSVLTGAKLVTSNADTAYSANILNNADMDGGEWIARGIVDIGKNGGDFSAKNDSSLVTNGNVWIRGTADFDKSKWKANGYAYIYKDLDSQESEFYFNDYLIIGQSYKNNYKGFTAFTSNNDKFVSKDSSWVNKIYGNADITNSDIAFLCPANVSGNWVANCDTILRLPVVKAGENYDGVTSNIYIPLNIDGTASGKATVYTVSDTDETVLVTPTLGDNYITGFAPYGTGDGASQDNPIQATFVLGNQDALQKGYYLKRVLDPMPSHSGNYYMWQVAQGEIPEVEEYHVKYDFSCGTRGGSLPDAVTNLLPVDSNTYAMGETVKAIMPSLTEVEGPKNNSDDTPGVWTFEGYDADSKVVSKETLTGSYIGFKGTWKWSKLEEYTVQYEFVSGTDGKILPDEINAYLPEDTATYKEGDSITIKQPLQTSVKVEDGTWSFQKYDKESPVTAGSSIAENGVITFTGTWIFTEDAKPPIQYDLTIDIQDMTAYTGGSSLNEDSFPAPRFKAALETRAALPEGGITLRVDGEEAGTIDDLSEVFLILGLSADHTLEDADAPSEDDGTAGVYTISISEEDADKVTASDKDGNEYTIHFTDGELIVRHVSDPEGTLDESFDIAEEIKRATPSEAPERPVAIIPAGSTFKTNNKEELLVLGDNSDGTLNSMISLMSDELLSQFGEDRRTDLIDRAESVIFGGAYDEDRNYEFKYLDLINETDGNAWVSSSLGSDIIWPYPDGTGEETDFKVIHFPKLHREYGFKDQAEVEEAIKACVPEEMKIEKTDIGIKFHVPESGFSPFAVTWIEGSDEPGGGTGGGGGEDPDPDVPGEEEKPDPDVPGEEEKPEDPDKPGEDEKPDDKPEDKPHNPGGSGGGGGTGGSGGGGGGGGSSTGRPGYVFGVTTPAPSDDEETAEAEDDTPGYIPPHPEYNKLPVMGSEILGPGYVGDDKLTEANGSFSKVEAESNSAAGESAVKSDTGTSDNAAERSIIPELSGLYAQNNDLLGWLTVPGTGNGYPVMNDPDVPTYYWHHTFDRQYSDVGVPFTAPFCTPDSDNILIHGHNMNGTLQFGNIWNYQYPSFRATHPVIDFKTIYDSNSQYEVMAIFFAPVYPAEQTGVFKWYQYAGDMNRNQFEYYVQNVKALSLYDTGVTAEYGDKLITLETCANTHDSTRLVVVARKKAV